MLHVNWNPLDALMHASHSLWITYQYMPKSNMNVEKHEDVSPESSLIRLKNEESCEHRVELSRSSFEVLFSTSSLMTLPSSIDQFSKYMKVSRLVHVTITQ
ncbi:unnamed protein product [Trichobilharzia regenti]|nr:unnamed protein product [Trichobilharzia regenti]